MIKTLKIKLKPNNKQQSKMLQFVGAKRFAYNWALSQEQINYKNGGKFIQDTELRKEFTPSSKLCHECGYIKKDLKLSDRTYICPECGCIIDRDYNASLNLRDAKIYEIA